MVNVMINIPCRVSIMGWIESGEGFSGLGWVGCFIQKLWVGFQKLAHAQL